MSWDLCWIYCHQFCYHAHTLHILHNPSSCIHLLRLGQQHFGGWQGVPVDYMSQHVCRRSISILSKPSTQNTPPNLDTLFRISKKYPTLLKCCPYCSHSDIYVKTASILQPQQHYRLGNFNQPAASPEANNPHATCNWHCPGNRRDPFCLKPGSNNLIHHLNNCREYGEHKWEHDDTAPRRTLKIIHVRHCFVKR